MVGVDSRAVIRRPNQDKQVLDPRVWEDYSRQLREGRQRAIREAQPPPTDEEQLVKQLIFHFSDEHRDDEFASEEDFVRELSDYHREEEFHIESERIVEGQWHDSKQQLFNRHLAWDIGHWRDATGTGFYRVWLDLSQSNSETGDRPWRICYQRMKPERALN